MAAAHDLLNELIRNVAALPDGERRWCAGVVVAAGQGPDILAEEPFGWAAVRYAAHDEATDHGVELPRERWVPTVRTCRRTAGAPGPAAPETPRQRPSFGWGQASPQSVSRAAR